VVLELFQFRGYALRDVEFEGFGACRVGLLYDTRRVSEYVVWIVDRDQTQDQDQNQDQDRDKTYF
jgi:hypothetical protein